MTHINEMDSLLPNCFLPPTSCQRSISHWKPSRCQIPSQPPEEGLVSFETATLELGRKEELRWAAGGRATGKHGTLIPSASR